MIRPPAYISSLKPYVPGKPIEELERDLGIKNSIKLASNENPLGPSPKALDVIKNSDFHLNRYPDGGGFHLRKQIAEIHGVAEEQIILGNGSNELLHLAANAYLTEKDGAVMAAPSFVVYHIAARLVGAEAVKIPLKEHRHDLKKMAEALTSNTKMVFIANPNNPTGTINTGSEFAAFMEAVPKDVLVVVDEAYCDYVRDKNYPDSLKYVKEGRGILVLRTFSKIYGLAGLRIGFGISRSHIINELNKIRPPFNTNTIAQMSASAALADDEHVRKSIRINEEGKAFLYAELNKLRLSHVPTEANFIYVMFDTLPSDYIYNELLKRGVIIRPAGDNAVRVTIGLPEENKKFIDAIKEVV